MTTDSLATPHLAQSGENRRRSYKYLDFVTAGFVTVLLCANLIGVSKGITVWGFTFSGGCLFFPLSYLFGDILTEVYGYSHSRRVVWCGFAALIFASFMSWAVIALPPAAHFTGQAALESVFGSTGRIVAASMLAYFFGEFTNSYVLARMKLWTKGKMLWTRTIGSTIFGEAVDSVIFYPLAFYGTWDNHLLLQVMMGNYAIKVGWEIVATPVTYRVVNWLKKAENEDFFDWNTKFTPFSIGD